jgi:hypothetical protein
MVPIISNMGKSNSPESGGLVQLAQRLRAVRRAGKQFLKLHAVQHGAADVHVLVDDLFGPHHSHDEQPDPAPAETALADPANHDWSLLYRGSVLDD